jgi:hypothetical protein
MSTSDIIKVLSLIATPLLELKKAVQKYVKDNKVKKELSDSLEKEADEFNGVMYDIQLAGEVGTKIILEVDKQPTPNQVSDFIDVVLQMPSHLARLLASYVHIAKACSELSHQTGFMESLLTTNCFVHDFVKTMSRAYIGNDAIKIDGSFFRFYKLYKSEIHKESAPPRMNPQDAEELMKIINLLENAIMLELKRKHVNRLLIKRWTNSFKILVDSTKDVTIEDVDYGVIDDFVPAELQEVMPFIGTLNNKSGKVSLLSAKLHNKRQRKNVFFGV